MNVGAKARRRRPVYVEPRVQASLGRAWDATQQPDQRQRWGVRFGSITSLPRVNGDTEDREANRIHYALGVIPYRAGDPHLR